MSYTPGPWAVGEDITAHLAVVKEEPLVVTVLARVLVTGDASETEANARLIAAAPDLLEALGELREQLRDHVKLGVKKHYSLMVAEAAAAKAIVKAKGGAA